MTTSDGNKPLLVIVTGLSGSGNSTALNALADSGLYCIDNLPIEMLSQTVKLIEQGRLGAEHGFAFGMDVRDRRFAEDFPRIAGDLRQRARLAVIFLTADEQVIATRYSTTRRRHPLLRAGETLAEAIDRERALLSPIEEAADTVFDTSHWSPHMLARAVEDRFSQDIPVRVLHVTLTSFGFKYGQHRPLDMMFDLRFLENPYFVPELKDKTGLDPAVRDYIFAREDATEMFGKIEDMVRFLLPKYHREGKHYVRIGMGCSGGRHRSVAFAEELGRMFLANPLPDVVATVIHRDIDR